MRGVANEVEEVRSWLMENELGVEGPWGKPLGPVNVVMGASIDSTRCFLLGVSSESAVARLLDCTEEK